MKNFKKFNISKTALINDYLRMRSLKLEKVNMSRGNKKLVSNDSVLFLVWNLPAVESFKKGDKFTRCRCSDCGTCQKCWGNYKDIRCEIH